MKCRGIIVAIGMILLLTTLGQASWWEEDVEIGEEGRVLRGTLVMPMQEFPPLILLLHGFLGHKDDYAVAGTKENFYSRTARMLAERGYASLRMDFRGSGGSDGFWEDTTFSRQIEDAMEILEYVLHHLDIDTERVGVIGLSQGGLVASALAARASDIASVALWSPVANPVATYGRLMQGLSLSDALLAGEEPLTIPLLWGIETRLRSSFFFDLFLVQPVAEIASYAGPLLVVVGSKDEVVEPQPESGQVFLRYHQGMQSLVVLDADHLFDCFFGSHQLDTAIVRTVEWFDTTLK